MVGGRGLVGPVRLEPADLAAADGDQALGLEDADRLADRREAHAELLDQLVLGGQAVDLLAGRRRMRRRSSAATVSAIRLRSVPACGAAMGRVHRPCRSGYCNPYKDCHDDRGAGTVRPMDFDMGAGVAAAPAGRCGSLMHAARPRRLPRRVHRRSGRPRGGPAVLPAPRRARACSAWPGPRSSAAGARRRGSRPRCARRCGRTTSPAARSTWASTGSVRRSCATAPTSSRRSTSRRSPRARSSGARASASPTPAPTWRRCRRPPAATATAGASRARRSGRRTRPWRSGASCWPARRSGEKKQQRAHDLPRARWTRRASRCGRSPRMLGPHHLNEVFFDDVWVTDADVLGTVDDGWTVVQEVLVLRAGGHRPLRPLRAPAPAGRPYALGRALGGPARRAARPVGADARPLPPGPAAGLPGGVTAGAAGGSTRPTPPPTGSR